MKKVLLAGSMNPHNKGDQARIKATIKKSTESHDISLALLSHYYLEDKIIYSKDSIEVVKAPWSGEDIKLFRMALIAIYSLIKYAFLSAARDLKILRKKNTLLEYDAMVIASGIDFSDYAGRLPLYYSYFLVTLFAIIMHKPVMCYAQSMGPIKHPLLRILTRFFLNRMQVISVRDQISYKFLEELKVSRPKTYLTVDPAFLLQPEIDDHQDILMKYGLKTCRPLIGISLSPTPFAGPGNGYCSMGLWYKIHKEKAGQLYLEYVRKMARLCDRIVKVYNAKLVFIPNCTAKGDDDRECLNKVRDLMLFQNKTVCINEELSLSENMKIIGACDLLLGTRLHTNIIATVMGVPLIPLVGTNGPRVPGIMRTLGLDSYIRNIMTTDEDTLMLTVRHVWDNREFMRCMVHSRAVEMREKAIDNIKVLRELCRLNGQHSSNKITFMSETARLP